MASYWTDREKYQGWKNIWKLSFFIEFLKIQSNKFFQTLQDDCRETSKKNPLSQQVGNFGPIVVKTYANLYHRIRSEDFFQTL